MPKFSVSVPDDLWEQAKAGSVTDSPSHVVQQALVEFVSSRAQRFEADGAQLDDVRELAARKRTEGEELFRRGYSAGLWLANEWPFELIDWASKFDFDLRELLAEVEHLDADGYGLDDLENDIIRLGFEGARGTLAEMGARQALRDFWREVRHGPQTSEETS